MLKYLLLSAVCILILSGCKKDSPVITGEVAIDLSFEAGDEPVNVDGFSISVYRTEDNSRIAWVTKDKLDTENLKLSYGDYYAKAEYNVNDPEYQSEEYFLGQVSFSVDSDFTSLIIPCKRNSVKITIEFTQDLISSFEDKLAILTTENGDSIFMTSATPKTWFHKAGTSVCYAQIKTFDSTGKPVMKKLRKVVELNAKEHNNLVIGVHDDVMIKLPSKSGLDQNQQTSIVDYTYIQTSIVIGPNHAWFGTFTDPRDGESYQVAYLDTLIWMVENFRYETPGFMVYSDEGPEIERTYGGYYTWATAVDIAPEGWRLPTRDDWEDIFHIYGNYFGDNLDAHNAYRALVNGGTSCFDFHLSGGFNLVQNNWHEVGKGGFYWDAEEVCDQNHICTYANYGFTISLFGNTHYDFAYNINRFYSVPTNLHNVRYVKINSGSVGK